MDNRQAGIILREFEAVRPVPPKTIVTKWKWATGVHLFPEAVCPFCKMVMQSPLIWQVDEKALRLKKIVSIHTGMMSLMRTQHPHVRNDGTICMNGGTYRIGAASSAAEALFLAINPQSSMLGAGQKVNPTWNKWLLTYFGHKQHSESGLRMRGRPKRLKAGTPKKTARVRATKS